MLSNPQTFLATCVRSREAHTQGCAALTSAFRGVQHCRACSAPHPHNPTSVLQLASRQAAATSTKKRNPDSSALAALICLQKMRHKTDYCQLAWGEWKGIASVGGVERRGVERRGVERRGVERRGVERRGVERRGVERRGVERRGVERRGVERRGVERRGVERRGVERRGVERRGVERRGVERRGVERRGVERHSASSTEKLKERDKP
ncbi:hypothetical protein NDU88_001587 [Pleurodeles waltl]|uniref:Uncharacterized protein n=1 Tax=Pleurodeles waltl TaxID=8319 RepID=A0AAV7R7J9_PLEWA|nr:hypothetical protein NDU88_001587 [Pleurodeles waltl]